MNRSASVILLALVSCGSAAAQTPDPGPGGASEKRSLFGRVLHPFAGSERLPEYKDARLRGLLLTLELSPQPVKLSELRQLDIKLVVTNKGRKPVTLEFPNEQRIEIYLRNSMDEVLTKWSDNHAFAEEPASVLINEGEHLDYSTTIATRELVPNRVFIAEIFFPGYPELRIRQKFLTAP